jgi:hypothetical protein
MNVDTNSTLETAVSAVVSCSRLRGRTREPPGAALRPVAPGGELARPRADPGSRRYDVGARRDRIAHEVFVDGSAIIDVSPDTHLRDIEVKKDGRAAPTVESTVCSKMGSSHFFKQAANDSAFARRSLPHCIRLAIY